MLESASPTSPMAIYRKYLDQDRLAYQFSLAANKPFFYPRVVCPYSGTGRYEWRISQGLGTVYAATRFYPRDEEAYAVVLVDLDEGFRMMSRVVDAPADAVAIGARVRLSIRAGARGEKHPFFTLEARA